MKDLLKKCFVALFLMVVSGQFPLFGSTEKNLAQHYATSCTKNVYQNDKGLAHKIIDHYIVSTSVKRSEELIELLRDLNDLINEGELAGDQKTYECSDKNNINMSEVFAVYLEYLKNEVSESGQSFAETYSKFAKEIAKLAKK